MNMTDHQSGIISAEMMVADLLTRYPHLRAVFDRYGLHGCGGMRGPVESIAFFARAHDVPEQQLLDELNDADQSPAKASPLEAPQAAGPLDELADTIYRRFFKAGIFVILTAGATWGALLLLTIGFRGDFTAISIHHINAHGHAQIFGWCGLFIMGFAYQAFPRIKHTHLWRPGLANLTFYLMVIGIFARAVGEPLHAWPWMRELAILATMAEVVAIALFAFILLRTFKQSDKPYQLSDGFILASLGFFIVQTVYDLLLVYATTAAASREALLLLVATYQAPLRDLQIHGFAMLMILGVGLRMFPALFGLAMPNTRLVRICMPLLILGVMAEAGFFIIMRRSGVHAWGMALYAGMLMVVVTSVLLTWRWGILAKPTESDRSIKFIRIGVSWLHVSMAMMVFFPLYMYVVLPTAHAGLSESGSKSLSMGFSHAYYGAVRHAITVGFISMTILGMAAKVVPTLSGVDVRTLNKLWLPFVLVNIGCAMRVSFQVGTDFAEWTFPLAGVSGLFEVTGIGIWGVQLWMIMSGRTRQQIAAARPGRITADGKVGLVIDWFPKTLDVFLQRGFKPLANPVMRRTLGRAISVRQAAAQQNLDLDEFLAELNDVAVGSKNEIDAEASFHSLASLPILK
jgi:iron-sulfur cluster repair protein YtfE (RIC family)